MNQPTNPMSDVVRRDAAERSPGQSWTGLSTHEAGQRLLQYGPNKLQQAADTPIWRVLVRQSLECSRSPNRSVQPTILVLTDGCSGYPHNRYEGLGLGADGQVKNAASTPH